MSRGGWWCCLLLLGCTGDFPALVQAPPASLRETDPELAQDPNHQPEDGREPPIRPVPKVVGLVVGSGFLGGWTSCSLADVGLNGSSVSV